MKLRGWAWFFPFVYAAGCGGPQELGNAGTKCYRDDDCEAGLICVAPEGKTARVCSNDPTPIVSMVDGPPIAEGGTAGTSGAAGMGGVYTAGAATAGRASGGASAGAATAGAATGGGGGTTVAGSGGAVNTAGTGGTESGGTESGGTDPGTAGSGGTAAEAGAPP